jgi:hypothetical protein
MGLALDKDGVDLHAAIPAETDSFGTFGLLEAALIELPRVGVVVVDGGYG